MPRQPRLLPLSVPVHVTNRGNDRRQVFVTREDYRYFIDLLGEALGRFAVEIYGYVAMPTHFHLVMSQRDEGAMSGYLHRVTGLVAGNFRSETTSLGQGHVFQWRFWSEAIKNERHLLAALRYVEANPKRASLVERAEDWEWSSLWERQHGGRQILSSPPVHLPGEWCKWVNRPIGAAVLRRLRCPVPRGRPRSSIDRVNRRHARPKLTMELAVPAQVRVF